MSFLRRKMRRINSELPIDKSFENKIAESEFDCDAPLLSVVGASKSYGGKSALSEVSFDVCRGKIIGLLGPNGSGKTTLMKLIAGLLTLDGGHIRVAGIPVGDRTKAKVAFLPERGSIPLHFTVGEAVGFYSDFFSDFDKQRAEAMLSDLRLEKHRPIKTLSKGTREKLQLVLIMSRRASLYLLDEPISGVDPAARDYIINTVLRSYTEESSILISTHLISDVQDSLDGFIMLNDGRIFDASSTEELLRLRAQTPDEYFREVFRC